MDLIKASNFNTKPIVFIETISYENADIDIIIIKNSKHKPYFLTKDKQDGRSLVRAGVVYTRDGCTNTPKNSTAGEYQIEKMWEERFDLYVKDFENWQCEPNLDDRIMIYYYKKFPEFTMEYHVPEGTRDYSDPSEKGDYIWMHSIGNSYETSLRFKYHTTVLKSSTLGLCDKSRYKILYPHIDYVYYNPNDLNDLHVFANDADISDKGKTISEIDFNEGNGNYRQVRFCYNLKNSDTYYIQNILNATPPYNIYQNYSYSDSSRKSGGGNKQIRYPIKNLSF